MNRVRSRPSVAMPKAKRRRSSGSLSRPRPLPPPKQCQLDLERSPEIIPGTDSEDDDENNPEKSIIEVESPDPRQSSRARHVLESVESPDSRRPSTSRSIPSLEFRSRPRRPRFELANIGETSPISRRLTESLHVLDSGSGSPEVSISVVQSPVRRRLVHSTKTIQKQMEALAMQIELEVVICYIWKGEKMLQVLVKDSENFVSLLVLPNQYQSELQQCLDTGVFFRFKALNLVQRVTTTVWMPLFSVIATFGCQQRIYYKLLISPETTWEVLQILDIEFMGITNCPSLSLQELTEVSRDEDCRFIITAKLKRKSKSQFYLRDDESQNAIKIKLIVLSSFQFEQFTRIDFDQPVKLHFMRYFRGSANIDQFSSVEQVQP